MRKNNRFFAFMVAASLCAVPFTYSVSMMGFAEEQTIYTGTCGTEGNNITWTYDASTQTMTFSGTGAMNDFVEGEEIPWMSGKLSTVYDARNVIYEEGITDVGDIISVSIPVKDEDEAHYDVTIPESATDAGWCLSRRLEHGITYHVKYGSWAYYHLYGYVPENRENCDIVATEVAEKEFLPTEGETEYGLRWKFDYETATLTLGGTDGQAELDLDAFDQGDNNWLIRNDSFHDEDGVVSKIWCAAETIVIEKDFIVPEDPEELQSITEISPEENPFYEMFKYNYLNYMIYYLGYPDVKTIYYYKDSPFEQEYKDYVAYYGEELPVWVNAGNDVICMDADNVACGDLNVDGNVNLLDAVYMNKYTAKVVDLSDAQKAAADCNGDGDVNDVDATTLIEFLILQIPSLPYQG